MSGTRAAIASVRSAIAIASAIFGCGAIAAKQRFGGAVSLCMFHASRGGAAGKNRDL
jgi:hypothetical protein